MRAEHRSGLAFGLLALAACGSGASGSPTCTTGGEGCPCYSNQTCDGGLSCEAEVCVNDGGKAGAASTSGGSSAMGGSGGNESGAGTNGTKGGSSAGGSATSGGSSGAGGSATSGGSSEGGSADEGGAAPEGGTDGTPSMGGSAGSPDCDEILSITSGAPEILIVLDRSASMQDPPENGTDSKWELLTAGLREALTDTDSTIAWGLETFPDPAADLDEACAPAAIPQSILVPIGANQADTLEVAILATTPEGNGTPTGDAVTFGAEYLASLTTSNAKFLLLATDGAPSCAGDIEDSDAARTYALQAIEQSYAAGFPVFVLGIDTVSNSAIAALDAMAVAGGRPRPVASSLERSFYAASAPEELQAALAEIAANVQSCVFRVEGEPPSLDGVALEADDQIVPRDPAHQNGWDFTNAAGTELEAFGEACELLRGATSAILHFCTGEGQGGQGGLGGQGGAPGAQMCAAISSMAPCNGISSGEACTTPMLCENLPCGITDVGRRACECTDTWSCTACTFPMDFATCPIMEPPSAPLEDCAAGIADGVSCASTQGARCTAGAEVCICWPDDEGQVIWDCDAPPPFWNAAQP